MTTRQFILDAVSTVPPFSMTVDGSTFEWGDWEALKSWFVSTLDINTVEFEVLLRWMVGILWQASGQNISVFKTQLNNLVGHTFTYTEPTVFDEGIV